LLKWLVPEEVQAAFTVMIPKMGSRLRPKDLALQLTYTKQRDQGPKLGMAEVSGQGKAESMIGKTAQQSKQGVSWLQLFQGLATTAVSPKRAPAPL
jgi:hypothetical protein